MASRGARGDSPSVEKRPRSPGPADGAGEGGLAAGEGHRPPSSRVDTGIAGQGAAAPQAAAPEDGPRPQLASVSTYEDAVAALARARRVLVVCGAGISVSCGVPDFRSAGGLYATVPYDLAEAAASASGLSDGAKDMCDSDPQCVFDARLFSEDPRALYATAWRLLPETAAQPSLTHRVVAWLARRKRLLRCYTQNIDGMESAAGVPDRLLVQCHGSMARFRCTRCRRCVPVDRVRADVEARRVPRCSLPKRVSKQKRAAADGDTNSVASSASESVANGGAGSGKATPPPSPPCGGVLRPDITLFGEKLSPRVVRLAKEDKDRADLLLVMGTSLKVAPLNGFTAYLPMTVPQLLINREAIRVKRADSNGFDVSLLGDADAVWAHLCKRLEWDVPGLPADSDLDGAAPRAANVPRAFLFRGAGERATAVLESAVVPAEEELIDVIVCDVCDVRMEADAPECWSCPDCAAFVGFDLCAKCATTSARAEHEASHVSPHVNGTKQPITTLPASSGGSGARDAKGTAPPPLGSDAEGLRSPVKPVAPAPPPFSVPYQRSGAGAAVKEAAAPGVARPFALPTHRV